jgi:signal peptidase I
MQENPTPSSVPEEAPSPLSVRASVWSALSWVRDLAFSVLIAVILIVFIYQPVKVEGTSMMPTLTDQERIFINKFTYHFGLGSIERGDMVVFWFPLDPSKSYIKRGSEYQAIQCTSTWQVYVNGHALTEKLRPRGLSRLPSWEEHRVPPDQYFVLGDHRTLPATAPHLGLRAARRDLRQGCFCLLAAEEYGPSK